MHIDVTSDELRYIRAAITLILTEREELIDTGRFGREVGNEATLEPVGASDQYEQALQAMLVKLPQS